MTGLARALVGAAVGAVLTLVLHPISRPYLTAAWLHNPMPSQEELARTPAAGGLEEDDPTFDEDGKTLRIAADNLAILKPKELTANYELAAKMGELHPENAYWRQMAAVFAWHLGKHEETLDLLRKAQESLTWQDYQTHWLQQIQGHLRSAYGSIQSWQFADVYWLRSLAPAEAIGSTERAVIDISSLDTDDGLRFRMIVMRNAALMRDNARSLAVGQIGADVVEQCCQPARPEGPETQRRLLIYRGRFFDHLRHFNRLEAVTIANELFEKNDSWQALINDPNAAKIVQSLSLSSVLAASLPGALMAAAAFGLFLWSLGFLVERSRPVQRLMRFPAILFFALAFAIAAYGITQLPIVGIAIGAGATIAGLTPRHNRSRPPSRLGPFFSFLTGVLALIFLALLAAYFVLGATPSDQVLQSMQLVEEQHISLQILLGTALVILSVLCLAAPMWAFAQRIRTVAVLSSGLKGFGAIVAIVGVVLGVIACPIAIYSDRHMQDTLYRLVVNEPENYYLMRVR